MGLDNSIWKCLQEEATIYGFTGTPEKIQEASQKLNDLFDLTQEVKLYKVKLEDFGNVELTSGQMQALLFMIEDKEEEE